MRIFLFILSTIITLGLIYALSRSWDTTPPMGSLLSPQQGFWQNAEPVGKLYDENFQVKGLTGKVSVYMDNRLVPHVFAESNQDAWFVQGFLHAKYRLWQMEFQVLAASGRISEKMGNDPRFLKFDREQRRMGMVHAAEQAAKEMLANPESKLAYESYSAGVNAYIAQLSDSELPLEYKILNYRPENWSVLKSALFLKQMSKTLAGYDKDLEFTNLKTEFSVSDIEILFPQVPDSLQPIIPAGTVFASPGIMPVKPQDADSLYFEMDSTMIMSNEIGRVNRNNGSNNWAVSGSKTTSGAPILCNDPHLELSLPSIWYEMQITTPEMNVYGASFPGTPSVIIGFNENIAFGFTNAQRDVKDYFYIRFKDDSKKEYWYNGQWKESAIRIDTLKIKGAPDFYDTIAYTVFGPVMYDKSFTSEDLQGRSIALKWTAHEPSNEGLMWLYLNKAKNYDEYEQAIKLFKTPGQNMVFASRDGDIALWQQAKFPARWQGQGNFIMPGEDSSYDWQGYIPQEENPHVKNPPSGFIQSANQRPVDGTYPYFIPGNYITARGIAIHNKLSSWNKITPGHMMRLQQDYYSEFAADATPLLLKYVDESKLNETARQYLGEVRGWDHYANTNSKATTIFQYWWDSLEVKIWKDEFSKVKSKLTYPDEQTLLELLLKDSAMKFVDDITTSDTESIQLQVTNALLAAATELSQHPDQLVWWKHKNPSVLHLLKTAFLPFGKQGLEVGGWSNTINAITTSHGPSWRMVVHLTNEVEAYGIYPGGQSGNPGSRFYDNFIDNWAKGNYYRLWMMKAEEANDKKVIQTITFN